MRRFTACVLLGFLVVSRVAATSSVWRAEFDGEVVYLGGTCHLLRASDFPLPAEFDAAYAAADVLYFETDLAAMQSPAMQMELLSRGMLADDSTLQDHLNEAAWNALVRHCEAHGVPLAAFAKMRPWMLAVTLAVLEWQKQGAVADGVDLHYHKQAIADGKPVLGLETVERHLDFLSGLAAGQESEMVLSTLADLESTAGQVDELIRGWRTGDLDYFDREMIAPMREEFPEVHEALVAGRNRDWLPKIMRMFATPEAELVLVGAGHFGGEDGLLAGLRARGAKVELLEGEPGH